MASYDSKIVTGYDLEPVTPSENPLSNGPCRALWIGTAGNLTITTIQGNKRTNVPAHIGLFPIQCSHVHVNANSPASNIWAIY